jgi:hypothetical protein
MLHAAKPGLGSAAATVRFTTYFLLACGIAMVVIGYVLPHKYALIMGAVLVLAGIVRGIAVRRFPQP